MKTQLPNDQHIDQPTQWYTQDHVLYTLNPPERREHKTRSPANIASESNPSSRIDEDRVEFAALEALRLGF